MNILIAPNAFKHALPADQVAQAIKDGLMQSGLACECTCFPVGDGGDGTGAIIIKAMNGRDVIAEVGDPLGRAVSASFGMVDGHIAVVEMANASGLRLLKPHELAPLRASSFGTGMQIRMALDEGAKKVLIAVGGSATVDGGTGILRALGAQFLDAEGAEINDLPEKLSNISSIDMAGLDERLAGTQIVVLCDVDNKLLGDKGAAAVFGPQKGASENDVLLLDKGLENFAAVIERQIGKDISTMVHGGAAGGVAAGLYGLLNAELVNGIEYFSTLTGFEKSLDNCQVVITGEGSIDEQTLHGKAPFGVAKKAKEKRLPVIAVAGKVPVNVSKEMMEYFDVVLPIGNEPMELERAIGLTEENLVRTGKLIGRLLKIGPGGG